MKFTLTKISEVCQQARARVPYTDEQREVCRRHRVNEAMTLLLGVDTRCSHISPKGSMEEEVCRQLGRLKHETDLEEKPQLERARYGQLFFRDAGPHDRHRMMMVLGAIALDGFDEQIKDGHQYTFCISRSATGELQLSAVPNSGINRAAEMRGNSASGILTSAIWKIG